MTFQVGSSEVASDVRYSIILLYIFTLFMLWMSKLFLHSCNSTSIFYFCFVDSLILTPDTTWDHPWPKHWQLKQKRPAFVLESHMWIRRFSRMATKQWELITTTRTFHQSLRGKLQIILERWYNLVVQFRFYEFSWSILMVSRTKFQELLTRQTNSVLWGSTFQLSLQRGHAFLLFHILVQ